MKNDLIFIQIAAYRDPELKHTLLDCIKKAYQPQNLRFSIAWQHNPDDEWDELDLFINDPRFKIIDIDYRDSLGVCWARNKIQQNYDGEDYTLQLDSHHRFIPNWDKLLIEMTEDLIIKGHKKPILTAYIPSYDPYNDPAGRVREAWWLQLDRFTPEGVVFFRPALIEGWEHMTDPIPSRFYSAHFAFSIGKFVEEVPHDPEYYFHGEEISIAVRAFTHGYDLFHPTSIIGWHEYTRKQRVKHWDENYKWGELNEKSLRRNKVLFGMDGICPCEIDFGKYGFGTERTLEQYEAYAGIRFRDRSVQQYTLDHNYAPNPKLGNPVEYINSFIPIFKHCIDLAKEELPLDDYDLIIATLDDADGNELYTFEKRGHQIDEIFNGGESYYMIWVEANTKVKGRPSRWSVIAHSQSKGWQDRIERDLPK